MKRERNRRVPIAAVFIVLLAWLVFLAARQAASDFYSHTISLEIDAWRKPGRVFRGDELKSATARMERSLEIAPGSAWAQQIMGALQLGRSRSATDPQVAIAAARAAYVNFKQSLRQQPSSSFAWSNLATAKLSLDEIDDELFDALARTAEFGPWESQPQLDALFVGLAVWGKANAAQRDMILAIRDRAALGEPGKVTEIAKGFSRLDLVCDNKSPGSKAPSTKGARPCPRAPAKVSQRIAEAA